MNTAKSAKILINMETIPNGAYSGSWSGCVVIVHNGNVEIQARNNQ